VVRIPRKFLGPPLAAATTTTTTTTTTFGLLWGQNLNHISRLVQKKYGFLHRYISNIISIACPIAWKGLSSCVTAPYLSDPDILI
jgi:hypothetical protein